MEVDTILGVPLIVAIAGLGLFWVRNDWTYSVRRKLLRSNMIAYDQLPSYNYMLWHFWIWDIDKFLPSEGK